MTKTKSQKERSKKAKQLLGPEKMQGKKPRNSNKGGAAMLKAPAAQFNNLNGRLIGMSDIVGHSIGWICGYTYVGNGTLGVTDAIYFQAQNSSTVIVPATQGGMVPILASDVRVGQTYVSDVEKHYARKRIRKVVLQFMPLGGSTSNDAMIYVAPVRGAGSSAATTVVAGTPAAVTITDILGMSGATADAPWAIEELDLTKYIAGGSGAKQNEFAISWNGTDSTGWGAGNIDLDGIAPLAFVIAGNNRTAANRGTRLHAIRIQMTCDYLDYLGGVALSNPLSFSDAVFAKFLTDRGIGLSDTQREVIFQAIVRSWKMRETQQTSPVATITGL